MGEKGGSTCDDFIGTDEGGEVDIKGHVPSFAFLVPMTVLLYT